MVNQKNVTGNESAVLRQRQVVPSDSSTVDLSNDSTLASSKNEQRKAKFDSLNPLPAPDPAPTQLTTTPISVPMVLAALISIPSNRSCSECRLQLVDSSQIYASFSPSLGQTPAKSYRRQSGIGDFQFNVDPATAVTGILGGHGVFTCEQCARAHRSLGDSICLVKSVKDASIWTATEVQYLSEAGGNLKSWKTYEGFMPTAWKQKRPSNKSNREERLMFVRAKYDALAFLTPPGGSYAPRSWNRILDLNPTMERWTTPDLRNFSKLTLSEAESTHTLSSSTVDEELPNRLVDFFCVIGHKEQLLPSEVRKDLYSVNSPSDLSLQSQIIDCYPAPGSYPDMDFPTHVNSFAFPDGCRVSESQKAPTFFSFVLTSSNGHKLYGGALHIYDETMETVKMKDVLQKSGYTVPLPWWISDPNDPPREYKSKGLPPPKPPSDVLFLPKCLLVISHYPFFQLWRKFLKQLHRVALAEAPLPIERYIANFVCEVPLPPQGKVSVKYGLLSDDTLTISRPPPNELPMANFSYRPLFTSLSVGNILVVFGELLQETKICLCSKHYSLLTPAAEALMSLLFPFEWQGLYVPVLSYPSMVDLLDAPVPFLVGLNATYLAEVGPEKRPHGVVFVDLDRDVVHLGFVEGSQGRSHRPKRRTTPDLPDRDSIKLKQRLDECADTMYIVPASGIKGMITSGNGQMLQNSSREPYAHMVISAELKGSSKRMETLLNADKAYSEEMSSVDGFSSEHGQQLSEHSERMTRSTLHTPTKTGKFPITGGKVLQALRIHKDNLTSLLRTNDEDFDDTDLGPKSLFTMAEVSIQV
jgi:DENN domain-containing protein 5